MVIRKVYQQHKDELTKIFRDHYRFTMDNFMVKFVDQRTRKKSLILPPAFKRRQSELRSHLIGHSSMNLLGKIGENKPQRSAESGNSVDLTFSSQCVSPMEIVDGTDIEIITKEDKE